MAGQPQLRESAVLYGSDPYVPEAMVRLEERMDGTGWLLHVNHPAREPTVTTEHPDPRSARAHLERVYAAGRELGRWEIRGR